ncbi:hypothetical protein U1Q18_039676, partial [Sarracenia purpurea var. burkii]
DGVLRQLTRQDRAHHRLDISLDMIVGSLLYLATYNTSSASDSSMKNTVRSADKRWRWRWSQKRSGSVSGDSMGGEGGNSTHLSHIELLMMIPEI